jgi:hypothetical protein
MNEYTASNGVRVQMHKDASMYFVGPNDALGSDSVEAAREFFRFEEDERLGRWRWPENQNYVVYPAAHDPNGDLPGGVNVVVDGSGDMDFYSLSGDFQIPEKPNVTTGKAARAYFDAHPEPKPWHNAKPGDIWLLSFHGFEDTEETPWGVRTGMSVNDAEFVYPPNGNTQPLTSPRIVAARRIFPEEPTP